MDETLEVLWMSFVPDDEPAVVVHPRKESLDLPAADIASQWATILCPLLPVRSIGRDHLDSALLPESLVQAVTVVGLVSNQSLGVLGQESVVQRVVDKRDFSWRSTRDPGGDRKTRAVCDCHDLGPLPALGLSDGRAPFLAPEKVPSMKASVMSMRPRWYKSSTRA